MPRLTKSVPSYGKHRASGQAVVTLNGKDHYLGTYGTKASRLEYDRLISEWMANGRTLPAEQSDTTIVELCLAYLKFAQQHYRKNGEPTKELDNIKYALRALKAMYGHTALRDFGPLALVCPYNDCGQLAANWGVVKQSERDFVAEPMVRVVLRLMAPWAIQPDIS
jgi:hypothetical protein